MEIRVEANEPQFVCTVSRGLKVLGYVAIDSTIGNRSFGGLRMAPDIGEDEVRGLARTMTLKHSFLGLPQGGAKAGVRGDPEAPEAERQQRLAAFGRAIAPLLRSRLYIPGADLGTTTADIRHMLDAVGVPVKRRQLTDTPGTQSGYYTALTVFTAAKQAARFLDSNLSNFKVAIEGFGKVGSALGQLLAAANARVVAVSTSRGAIFNSQGLDMKQLTQVAREEGSLVVERYANAERIDRASLLELSVDLLCPCAGYHSLNTGNADRTLARIVCPGANNPIAPEAERVLFDRGVLCLPDFVTNSGGVLGCTMEFASVRPPRIAAFIDSQIGARVAWLLSEAKKQRVSPRDIAMSLTLRRFEQVRRRAAYPTPPLQRLFGVGLELYRRGWIPERLVASLSLPFFERALPQEGELSHLSTRP